MNEGQYTLSYYTVDDLDPAKPPFKYRSFYLEDALAEAWRIQNTGGRAENISQADTDIINQEELLSAFLRISELSAHDPARDAKEIARQVVLEKEYLPTSN